VGSNPTLSARPTACVTSGASAERWLSWLKAAVSKPVMRGEAHRGFESPPLRQRYPACPPGRPGARSNAASRQATWYPFSPWAISSGGERLLHTQEVVGSNPTLPTISLLVRRDRDSRHQPLRCRD